MRATSRDRRPRPRSRPRWPSPSSFAIFCRRPRRLLRSRCFALANGPRTTCPPLRRRGPWRDERRKSIRRAPSRRGRCVRRRRRMRRSGHPSRTPTCPAGLKQQTHRRSNFCKLVASIMRTKEKRPFRRAAMQMQKVGGFAGKVGGFAGTQQTPLTCNAI